LNFILKRILEKVEFEKYRIILILFYTEEEGRVREIKQIRIILILFYIEKGRIREIKNR